MIKYRVHEVAKDFKLNSKDIAQIMTKYCTTPKNHMQVLTDLELAIIFERITQSNQIDSIESVYAEVYHEPNKKAAPAAPVEAVTTAALVNAPEEEITAPTAPVESETHEQTDVVLWILVLAAIAVAAAAAVLFVIDRKNYHGKH